MNKTTLIFVSLLLPTFSSATNSKEIQVLGLNAEGNPIEFAIPKEQYRNNLRKAFSGIQEGMIPKLRLRSETKPETTKDKWLLRTVVVGLGVAVEAGIGPLKLGFLPRFRVGFSNCKEPSVP